MKTNRKIVQSEPCPKITYQLSLPLPHRPPKKVTYPALVLIPRAQLTRGPNNPNSDLWWLCGNIFSSSYTLFYSGFDIFCCSSWLTLISIRCEECFLTSWFSGRGLYGTTTRVCCSGGVSGDCVQVIESIVWIKTIFMSMVWKVLRYSVGFWSP